jgi:hypothetical protein
LRMSAGRRVKSAGISVRSNLIFMTSPGIP